MSGRARGYAACAIVFLLTRALSAQEPFVNAVLEHRAVSATLAREIDAVARQGRTAWIAYRVPMVESRGDRMSSIGNWHCRLEPPDDLLVLARVENRQVVELRTEQVDCDVNASGMPVVVLDGVKPGESITWLASFIGTSPSPSRVDERALTAIALHADATAGGVLVSTARAGATATLRSRALFWLAVRAASDALPAINRALDEDPDTRVKKQAVFALSQMPKDQGVPRLIDLARHHPNVEVRRQAMFWLGQSKDPRAVDFFASILK